MNEARSKFSRLFLEHAAKSGALSHAYILSGNDEEAKERAILMTASLLNCESRTREDGPASPTASQGRPASPEDGPCARCRACKDIAAKSHPDLVWMGPLQSEDKEEEPEKEIRIGQMRNLVSRVSMGTWNSPYTIVAIEQAHRMNTEAQSAFLKLLEEPKGNTIFFLLVPHSALLLPTMRSRAQELRWYSFSARSEKPDENIASLIQTIRTSCLADRFLIAKKMADAPERVPVLMEEWVRSGRHFLLQELQNSSRDFSLMAYLKTFLLLCEEARTVIQRTSANPRLGIEYIMCKLP